MKNQTNHNLSEKIIAAKQAVAAWFFYAIENPYAAGNGNTNAVQLYSEYEEAANFLNSVSKETQRIKS